MLISSESIDKQQHSEYYFYNMPVHIGELIEKKLTESGIKPQVFADRANIGRDNIYKIFKRKSIQTDLLVRISEALQYNFFLDLSKEPLIDDWDNHTRRFLLGEEQQASYGNNYKDKYFDILEKYTNCLEENQKLKHSNQTPST